MLVHGLDGDGGHHERAADATRRADGAEQIGLVETPVTQRARTAATLGPDAGQGALLADTRLVLEPDLDRLAAGSFGERIARKAGEVFLRLSYAARLVYECCGRTDRGR